MEGFAPNLEFLYPAWILVAVVGLAWVAWGYRKSLVDFSRTQRLLSLTVRSLIVALLTAALAGLTWNRQSTQRYWMLLIDRSASMSADVVTQVDAWSRQLRQVAPTDRVAAIEFSGQPGRVRQMQSDASMLPATEATPTASLEPATDLAAAIQMASAAVPTGFVPHLVIFSDGRQTRGDALATARSVAIPISTIPSAQSDQPQTQLGSLHAPSQVDVGQPFELQVAVHTTTAQEARLELYRDQLQVELDDEAAISLVPGENVIRLRQQIDRPIAATYSVRVVSQADERLDDNQLSAMVVATGKPNILLVDNDPASLDPLRWALEDQQMNVEVRPASGMPDTLAAMLAYDAIVLSDVPAPDLQASQLDLLSHYVRELGGGLVMLGGEHSFGLGGYHKTPLESVLPVDCDLQQEKERPSLAIVLVLDRSGSMGGMKIELAKDAARGVVELLGPRDQIGIVAFDDEPYWVNPLEAAADKSAIEDRISRLASAGGTNLYPALAQAQATLDQAVAKLKHVIVLSDGISAPADFAGLVADMTAARITLSTVAVGDKADRDLLQDLATQGSGRHYVCRDPRAVPQIFAQETIRASKSVLEETPFLPVAVRSDSALRGIDLEALPLLMGYVVTRPKPTSEVILATEEGDPLLARWRIGLGTALAYTSDTKNRWASEWLVWPDFATFWAQSIRRVMRQRQAESGELRIEQLPGQLLVSLELRDRDQLFLNHAQAQLTLLRPSAEGLAGEEREQMTLRQVAPGRYETTVAASTPGAYLLEVQGQVNGQVVYRHAQGAVVGYPEELRLGPVNHELLRQLAEQSGGQYQPSPADVCRLSQQPVLRPVPLWRSCVTLALLLLVVDVALRRLQLFGSAST